jgi:hypothetical protein
MHDPCGMACGGRKTEQHRLQPGWGTGNARGFAGLLRRNDSSSAPPDRQMLRRFAADSGSAQDFFAGCEDEHQRAEARQEKTTLCRVFREASSCASADSG